MRTNRFFVSLLALALLPACNRAPNQNTAAVPKPSPPVVRSESLPKIVAFGDSLTAGLGLSEHESYPALVQKMLERDGYKYEVVNAGVSGDTSAGGVRRIDWAMDGDVKVVILELGANDLLRGQPIPEMKKNLGAIIDKAKGRGAKVLLAGMYAPTNTGIDYQRQSQEAFQSLAREKGVTLIPFFLDRVAGVESLNQADGIHPNPEGTRLVAETVYKSLKPMLEGQ
jgi:acyl-CoA thioesterase-1